MQLLRSRTRARPGAARSALAVLALTVAAVAIAVPSGSSAGASYEVSSLGDLWPGEGSSFPERTTRAGDLQFFRANDGVHGYELWVTNGTLAGTRLVEDINPGPDSSYPGSFYLGTMVGSGDRLFFFADDGAHGEELWVSDGSSDGTSLVRDAVPGAAGSVPTQLVAFQGGVVYAAFAPSTGETGLWRSDGTEAGSFLVKAGTSASPTVVGDNVFFAADDMSHGTELWMTDGTPAGTVMVEDISSTGSSTPRWLTEAGGRVFFTADDGAHGEELWASDGTPEGTVRLSDIWPGPSRTPLEKLTKVGDDLYFVAYRPEFGQSLWRSDGTEAGTTFVWDGDPNAWDLGLDSLTGVGDTLFFRYVFDPSGPELWKSDGSEAGTTRVADINATWGGFPEWLTRVDATLFFQANDGVHGRELWATDGTEAGTVLVADLNPGEAESAPVWLSAGEDALFFGANDGTHGWEPHVLTVEADITPPELRLPASVIADATSPTGGPVDYGTLISASDNSGADPTVSCAPPSGSIFAIGVSTLVECTATDGAGNTTHGSFPAYVRTAPEQIDELAQLVKRYGLAKLGSSLSDKLGAAQRQLTAGKRRQAEETLGAFLAQVDAQRGKGLTASQADAVTAGARRIIDVIDA
jgi:ELWxxDGT repeat protein